MKDPRRRRKRLSAHPRNPRHCHIFLDANALRRLDEKRSALVDQFLSLTQDLSVIKPHGMEAEILHPNSPSHVQHDMDGIYTLRTDFNDDEIVRRESLRSLMTGNSRSNKHLADADHLFEAWKYGGRYFVTHDKRILNATPRLRQIIPGVEPVTLEDMVSILKAYAPEQE